MAENSSIEWTNHTFNGIRGCVEISPACDHCYARVQSKRNPRLLGAWGSKADGGVRVLAPDAYWKAPLVWDAKAAERGIRERVFAYSLADVFERWDDTLVDIKGQPVASTMDDTRGRLFQLINNTPNLDWLLLTKRPENIEPMLSKLVFRHPLLPGRELTAWDLLQLGKFPNVWFGTTVENQEQAGKRIPELIKIPATVRFLSMEPLLGPVDLRFVVSNKVDYDALTGLRSFGHGNKIDWVIAGGESGPEARPSHPDWFRSLRDQCVATKTAFFFKQWGDLLPHCQSTSDTQRNPVPFPSPHNPAKANIYYRVGKKVAGRSLDSVEWSQFPEPRKGDSL